MNIFKKFARQARAQHGLALALGFSALALLSSPPPSASAALPSLGRQAKSGDQEFLNRASKALNEIAQSAMPAVVSISVIRKEPPHPLLPPGFAPPGMDEAEEPGGLGGPDARMVGVGSGIIIRPDGMVLTNHHVVEDAERITVTFDEKHKTKARLVGSDPKTDLAVIQIESPKKDYPIISFGDSDKIREGDWAIAIGSPFGLNRSVSFGIISAKGRAQMGILDIEDFIQTDAAINPGSSGGPLVDASGQLIGVNTAIFSQDGGNMGIGFSIPSKIAKEISGELINKGRVSRGWAGLMAQDLDSDLAKYFKVKAQQGALISEVVKAGPAGKAQIEAGDVVTRFNNQPITGASDLKSLVGKSRAGTAVVMEVIRDGKNKTVNMTIQEQPLPPAPPATQQAGQVAKSKGSSKQHPTFGLAVEDVPREIARYLNLPAKKGILVIGVNPGSPAFDAGIGPGDIILSANRTEVHTAKEFNKLAKEFSKEDVAVLYVQRGPGEKLFIPLKMNGDSAES